MSSSKKNSNDFQKQQAKANARASRRQGYSALDKGARQLEQYTEQLETTAGGVASNMGQSGMFTFGGPGGRSMNQFRDAEEFGVSMADTDADSIAGFDRERFKQIKDELDNLDIRGIRGFEAITKYLARKRELEDEKEKLKPARGRANRIRSGWERALSDVGDTELSMPRQLRMATGSNLLNVSKMRANMQRDVANIQNAAMTAADDAFFASQQQREAADTLGQMADAQRRAETTQNIIGGIAGAGLLIGGTLLTGGAAGVIGGAFSGASASAGIGMMGSGVTQFGSSFI
jgi:hypothetical protein